jgi:hypothetical protein
MCSMIIISTFLKKLFLFSLTVFVISIVSPSIFPQTMKNPIDIKMNVVSSTISPGQSSAINNINTVDELEEIIIHHQISIV